MLPQIKIHKLMISIFTTLSGSRFENVLPQEKFETLDFATGTSPWATKSLLPGQGRRSEFWSDSADLPTLFWKSEGAKAPPPPNAAGPAGSTVFFRLQIETNYIISIPVRIGGTRPQSPALGAAATGNTKRRFTPEENGKEMPLVNGHWYMK